MDVAHDRPFSLTVRPPSNGLSVVEVAGELDLLTAPRLRHVLLDPSLCPGPDVQVDLRQVTFIDSISIGTLVAARRFVASRGGSIVLACAPGVVTRVLTITKLDTVFGVEIDEPGQPAAG